jgi:hypothetical protein
MHTPLKVSMEKTVWGIETEAETLVNHPIGLSFQNGGGQLSVTSFSTARLEIILYVIIVGCASSISNRARGQSDRFLPHFEQNITLGIQSQLSTRLLLL